MGERTISSSQEVLPGVLLLTSVSQWGGPTTAIISAMAPAPARDEG